MSPFSMKMRVALPAALVMLAVVTLCYLGILALLQNFQHESVVADRTRSARDVAVAIEGRDLPNPLPIAGKSLLQVLSRNDEVRTSSPAMAGKPALPITWPKVENRFTETRICPNPVNPEANCLIAMATLVQSTQGEVAVVSAAPEPPFIPNPRLAIGFATIGLATVALAGVGTWLSAYRSLLPVGRLRGELDDITATNLKGRVPVPNGARDEISQLVKTVNATLDRLEEAVISNKSFVANASHELRSPLAALRSQAEVAILHPDRVPPERALGLILADVDRLESLVSDLLLLARLDAGHRTVDQQSDVDLVDVVLREISRRDRRVPVETDLVSHVIVLGNDLGLTRLFVNLLDNACRHAETKVLVRITKTEHSVMLEVLDDGPGIPKADRERVFQRFTRLDAGRGRGVGGSGLGLALARDLATAHGGTLTVEEAVEFGQGARLVLKLPLTS